MTTPGPGSITLAEFQAIVHRAGLDLDRAEMEHLLPIYQQFAEQLRLLHDPNLPREVPAVTFVASDSG